jgi:ankyrin repeat protein
VVSELEYLLEGDGAYDLDADGVVVTWNYPPLSDIVEKEDAEHRSLLEWAAQLGRDNVVTWLLSRGCEASAQNPVTKQTALHRACEGAHMMCAHVLCQHGARGDLPDENGYTALDLDLAPLLKAAAAAIHRDQEVSEK